MDVAGHAQPSADRECSSIVLEWLREGLEDRLPGRALRHRPFSHREKDASCRAVRVRSPGKDLWALQVERTPDPGRQVTISLSVASNDGRPTRIGVEVHDRSVAPGAAVEEYPSGLVAEIAGRIPLLQNGRRFVRDAIVIDTEGAMRGFLDNLVDPTRDVPFAVASMRTEEADRDMLADRWTALARALAGLAAVWVLPPAMTFRLSDAVGKSRSAFKGAWRFYRPGFNDRADLSRHPLVLWDRLADERGLAAATTQFQRLAAEERLRFGPGDRDTLGFDAIAGEAAAAPRGTRRLVALVRNAIRRDSAAPKSGSGGDRYKQAQRRVEAAERDNEELRKRVEQLAGLARSLGGDPDVAIPFPVKWDQVADWCDQSLAGRVSLTGSAKREMGGAEFANVGLAALCLSWLGRRYRDGRLRGGAPDLRGRIICPGARSTPSYGSTANSRRARHRRSSTTRTSATPASRWNGRCGSRTE